MADHIQKRANSCVSLPTPSKHDGKRECARSDATRRACKYWNRCRRRELCNAEVVASENAGGISPDFRELHRSFGAVSSVERHPGSHPPAAIPASRGVVDGALCSGDHSLHCCGGMVVEAEAGLCPASKSDYRSSVARNVGCCAFRPACCLALEHSQARRLTQSGLSVLC